MAIKFGIMADCGPPPYIKFDQVRFPKEKIKGPIYKILYIALFTKSLPGYGLLLLVNKACFCTQYIKPKPASPNIQIIG